MPDSHFPWRNRVPLGPARPTWRDALAAVLPDQAADIEAALSKRWRGANLYIPLRTARLRWRGAAPAGAAERFAADVRDEILARGGSTADVLAVLLAVTQRRFVV